MKRQILLVLVLLIVQISFCLAVKAQETMKFDSEAKKLEFVRQMLAKEKYLRPGGDKPVPHCELMMKDLLTGKNFKAIEPDVRADSVDDPRLAKWKKCEDEMISPLGFHSLNDLGGPPYRYYKIELDGNKDNGPEDIIYYNMYKTKINGQRETLFGRTGYAWVDGCEIKYSKVFHIAGALEGWSRKPNAVYLNTLVYYKGQLWAMEFIDGFGISFFHWYDDRMDTCFWVLYEPTK
jgi:hypothetical protein